MKIRARSGEDTTVREAHRFESGTRRDRQVRRAAVKVSEELPEGTTFTLAQRKGIMVAHRSLMEWKVCALGFKIARK